MNKPLYRCIADDVRGEILAGKYAAGRLPSEGQLIRRYGSTHATVSRALGALESEGLIIRRAGSGSFVRENVKKAAPVFVSTLISELGDSDFFEPISASIAEACRSCGLNLVWGSKTDFSLLESEAPVSQLIEHYRQLNVKGVFFAPDSRDRRATARNQEVAAALTDAGITVVLLDRDIVDFPQRGGYDLVGIDNVDAGYRQARALLQGGATRIVYATRKGTAWTMRGRIAGVRTALAEANLPFTEADIVADDEWSAPFLRQVLAARRPDGIVCFNDAVAAGVLRALNALRVKVPGKVAVIGLDDVPFAKLLSPPLTTLRQPVKAIGEEAARVMSARLGHDTSPPRRILFDVALVSRATVQKPS